MEMKINMLIAFGIIGTRNTIAFRQPEDMAEDQVICANETGVVGRFQQHIGQVMTCVGHDVGMNLHFGDWHLSGQGPRADIAIWSK